MLQLDKVVSPSMNIETVSDVFYARTRKRYLYNITAIENIPSIMQIGIVCFDDACKIKHNSIAINNVQQRRAQKRVTNGLRLHQYANLYFSCRNPMMYYRKDIADSICVLAVDASVLDIEDCVVSDMNAAKDLVRFYPAYEGVGILDFEKIYARSWIHDGNPLETQNHKAIKCAEVLIPYSIPSSFIRGAYVVSEKAKEKLEAAGFDRKIVVSPDAFFH